MICYPNAKINLGLNILSKRKDHFHNVDSFFLPIPIFDILEVNLAPEKTMETQITYSGLNANQIKNDLVIRAYNLLKNDFPIDPVKIHLHKNIPFGAGMGGGSSDATFMLVLLNNLFNLRLTQSQLLDYSMRLGSDCPFFIFNCFSKVSSVGDVIKPINFSFKDYYMVVFKPNIHCSTKDIFEKYTLQEDRVGQLDFNPNHFFWKRDLINDLEQVTFSIYPELKKIKSYLYSEGALYASMTGSGSAIYGIFDHEPRINSRSNFWFWKGSLSS